MAAEQRKRRLNGPHDPGLSVRPTDDSLSFPAPAAAQAFALGCMGPIVGLMGLSIAISIMLVALAALSGRPVDPAGLEGGVAIFVVAAGTTITFWQRATRFGRRRDDGHGPSSGE